LKQKKIKAMRLVWSKSGWKIIKKKNWNQ